MNSCFWLQITLIFGELGPKFRDLLELGRAGVVAALVAASQRHLINQREVFYIHLCIIRHSSWSCFIVLFT